MAEDLASSGCFTNNGYYEFPISWSGAEGSSHSSILVEIGATFSIGFSSFLYAPCTINVIAILLLIKSLGQVDSLIRQV